MDTRGYNLGCNQLAQPRKYLFRAEFGPSGMGKIRRSNSVRIWRVKQRVEKALRAASTLTLFAALLGAQLVMQSEPALAVTSLTAVQSLTVGHAHNCVLDYAGAASCWGQNDHGQLGNGTTTNSSVPVAVSGSLTFSSIDAGFNKTCAITTAGDAYCWGENISGQLGNGTATPDSNVPVLVSGGRTWASISVGYSFGCGVTTAGAGYCWGGIEGTTPVLVSGGLTWRTISAGGAFMCGVTTSNVGYCWRRGTEGQLGNGVLADTTTPSLVSGSLSWSTISAGEYNACGVTTTGVGYCWGNNSYGDLGNGGSGTVTTPSAVSGGHVFSSISMGYGVACGVTTAHVAKCWGANGLGAIGDGTNTDRNVPTTVTGGYSANTIGAGGGGECMLTTGAAVYCWGWNAYGQLGNSATTNTTSPVGVIGFAALDATALITAQILPSLTFTVAGRATTCNGQSSSGFQTGATATAVSFGHLNPAAIIGGAQNLSIATNAANGFIVYVRTTGTAPNVFRTAGGATLADVAGTHASPSASTAAGTAGFGYTTSDALIAFGSDKWAALTATSETVMTAAAGTTSKSVCTGFQATIAGNSIAGTYAAPVVYTAVPLF